MPKLMPSDLDIKQRTMYDNMGFDDYEFREFPMGVPVVDGKVMPTPYDERNKPHPIVIVNSQAELDALKKGAVLVEVDPTIPNSPQRIETEDDQREALYVKAEQAGATIDKQWSIERIESAIAKHKASKNKGGGEVV